MLKHLRLSSTAILLCCLLLLVSACSLQPPVTSTPNTPTAAPGTNSATPTGPPQTQAMPATQTACPAAGTARPAIMRYLALGQLQNLVYIYNEVPQNTSIAFGHLRRYDVSNGHKAEIASSGVSIDQAQISADGQWVLFLSIPDARGDKEHSAMLQLVRMDGAGLQTLYCFPTAKYSGLGPSGKLPIAFQWSVDQKSIIVSVNTDNTTSQIFIIDVATGNMRQLFHDQNNQTYAYNVITWLDNTHVYIVKQGLSGPTPPATIYLMDTSTATLATPGLQQIMTTQTRMSYYALDSSYDGKLLYSSYCLMAASPFSTNVQVGPATGGARNTIYQEQPNDCIQSMRAISSNTLLLLMLVSHNGTIESQLWTLDLLGHNTNTLTTLSNKNSGQSGFNLNPTSQFPWSNVSRDGGFYALQAVDPVATNQTILVGSLKGGAPTAVAVTNPGTSSVSLAGWTTL